MPSHPSTKYIPIHYPHTIVPAPTPHSLTIPHNPTYHATPPLYPSHRHTHSHTPTIHLLTRTHASLTRHTRGSNAILLFHSTISLPIYPCPRQVSKKSYEKSYARPNAKQKNTEEKETVLSELKLYHHAIIKHKKATLARYKTTNTK
jgi:hypothetical protein